MILGTVTSVVHGAGFPLLSVVLGGLTTIFLRAQISDLETGERLTNDSDASLQPINR